MKLRIATRQSPLALWQARHVADRLEAVHSGLHCELVGMTTKGDRFLAAPLQKMGGKGLFIKELEESLLDQRADIAVHSMKDMTVDLPSEFALPIILERGDPQDALVSPRYSELAELPERAKVGSSSLRRGCQIRARRPDLVVEPVRGNVQTRLAKLDDGAFDALILAVSGLQRLSLGHRISEVLAPETMLPAIGQGAFGVECRADDSVVHDLLAPLDDPRTHDCVRAERRLNQVLAGGCHAPVAGFATLSGDRMRLRGLVGRPDGSHLIEAEAEAARTDALALGEQVGEALLAKGAAQMLEGLR